MTYLRYTAFILKLGIRGVWRSHPFKANLGFMVQSLGRDEALATHFLSSQHPIKCKRDSTA